MLVRCRILLVVGVLFTIGLAACGSSDAEDAEATTSVATTAPATSSTTSATSSPSSTSEEVPEPSDEAPVDAAEPASVEQRGIWAPPGQGHRCPGTDAYVWDFADCNPSNGVIDPDEFYRLMEGGGAHPIPDTSGAYVRAPEEEAEKEAAHSWWAECIAANDAEICRENDPWQQ